jgi:AmmeMemoRadiSam system protein A
MAMNKELHPLVQLARRSVENYVNHGKIIKPGDLTPEMQDKAGVFVSLKKRGQLRGCIGTFEPMEANVAEEIIRNAVSSAVGDPRFSPVKPSELGDLEYSVDVLTHPEPVEDKSQLDPKKYGLIVQSGYRRGLLLPDLEGVDDVELQIDICKQKAGIMSTEPIKMYRFQVKRYR